MKFAPSNTDLEPLSFGYHLGLAVHIHEEGMNEETRPFSILQTDLGQV